MKAEKVTHLDGWSRKGLRVKRDREREREREREIVDRITYLLISLSDLCTKGVFVGCSVDSNKVHYTLFLKDYKIIKDILDQYHVPRITPHLLTKVNI